MNAITLTVNDRSRSAEVEPRTHLADFLREDLLLTGTHLGCEHGVCGACTLMLDGRPVRSCLTYAASCDGAQVKTVEGYGADPLMAALRAAFSRHHALQCGFCTPGMLATAYDIVRRLPNADEARIREELSGNLCRCTGYAGIVAAIADVLGDPPMATIQPISRPERTVQPTVTARAAELVAPAAPTQASATVLPIPDRIEGAVTLTRSLRLDVPADRLWSVLQDIPSVVACLPGAALDAVPSSDMAHEPLAGRVAVAIGPITANFIGRALVGFDEAQRSGWLRGSGGDPVSRTNAEGELRFHVEPDGDAAGRIEIALAYRLKGPLAQFGRPAVVADVVDRLLERFSANLKAIAEGGEAVHAEPVSGLRLVAELFFARLKRLFGLARG